MIYISSCQPSTITQLKQKKKEKKKSVPYFRVLLNYRWKPTFYCAHLHHGFCEGFNSPEQQQSLINAVKRVDSMLLSVDSCHHPTSCFSFLTGFSHFIISHFWLNSSEWNWADVAVGIVQGFLYKFLLLILCRLHIYKHQWLFFSLLFWSHRINTQDFAFEASRQAHWSDCCTVNITSIYTGFSDVYNLN